MRLTVEKLRHELDVFLWENPAWASAKIVFGEERGGYMYASRVKSPHPAKKPGKPFEIEFEEKIIYESATRQSEDSI